jgi:hypothetical protein
LLKKKKENLNDQEKEKLEEVEIVAPSSNK